MKKITSIIIISLVSFISFAEEVDITELLTADWKLVGMDYFWDNTFIANGEKGFDAIEKMYLMPDGEYTNSSVIDNEIDLVRGKWRVVEMLSGRHCFIAVQEEDLGFEYEYIVEIMNKNYIRKVENLPDFLYISKVYKRMEY